MRVSSHFHLNASQGELDFVDVDCENDLKVYIDPRALRLLPSTWAQECVSLIQNFFQHVLDEIRSGSNSHALRLIEGLSEPNETHLGLSRGKSRGRGIGRYSAYDVWSALSKSEAVKTGLLTDLEETILFIRGIGTDLLSDMATNIIRAPLIEYTGQTCLYYGISTTTVDSGPLWDPRTGSWFNQYCRLPIVAHKKLLLVPKVIVRQKMDYDADEYFRHYLLTYLQDEEIRSRTELVRLLKNGSPRVTKKDLIEKYGADKETIAELTQRFPQVLENYREAKQSIQPPLTHEEIASIEGDLRLIGRRYYMR